MTLATDKQLSFLASLFAERSTHGPGAEQIKAQVEAGTISKVAASKWIEFLLTEPRKPKAESTRPVYIDPPVGMHELDGEVTKVYRTRNGHVVAKRLSTLEGKPAFGYVGKRGLRGLSEKTMMSAGSAAKFGRLYGMCVNCSATLTDERSVLVGYGPVCASNNGWPYPTMGEALEGLEAASLVSESTEPEETPVEAPAPAPEVPEAEETVELSSSSLFSLL